MEDVRDVHELAWRADTDTHLGLDLVDPADELGIEVGVAAHVAVHLGAVLEQTGQDVIDVADGKSVVGAVVLHRALEPGTAAVPSLLVGIALAAEENELALVAARRQHSQRLRLGKVCQVIEIAVGAKPIGDIAVANGLWSGWNHGHPFAHQLHDAPAASRKDRIVQIDLRDRRTTPGE